MGPYSNTGQGDSWCKSQHSWGVGVRAEDPDSRSITLAAMEVLDLPGVHETVKKKGKEGGVRVEEGGLSRKQMRK